MTSIALLLWNLSALIILCKLRSIARLSHICLACNLQFTVVVYPVIHLMPMWPGFNSRSRCHMWVEFIIGSRPCSEGFFRELRFSSIHKNQHFHIPIRPGRQVFTREPLAPEIRRLLPMTLNLIYHLFSTEARSYPYPWSVDERVCILHQLWFCLILKKNELSEICY